MKGTITIGSQGVEMVANAASPHLYKTIFREDFLRETQNPDPDPTIFQKMGFVMALQASGKPTREILTGTTEDDFYEWLEQFEALDLIQASADIANLFTQQRKPTQVPKKKAD